jgi:hypothetical protein
MKIEKLWQEREPEELVKIIVSRSTGTANCAAQ